MTIYTKEYLINLSDSELEKKYNEIKKEAELNNTQQQALKV
jgi:hypothetical protein